jgi:hypothetical protein
MKKSSVVRYGLLAAGIVGAFFMGRVVATKRNTSVGLTSQATEQRVQVMPTVATKNHSTQPVVPMPTLDAGGSGFSHIQPELAALVELQPDQALMLHQQVIAIMAQRRKNKQVRDCPHGSAIGFATLRFAVAVEQEGSRLQIGTARYIEVKDGVDIPAELGACYALQLSGEDKMVDVVPVGNFHGEIDYVMAFEFP